MKKLARESEFEAKHNCSPDDFLRRCGFSPDDADAAKALIIRDVLAHIANVRVDSICPEHTYRRDLAGLGLLDSLDQVEFIMQLEDRLGRRIPDKLAERLRGITDRELYDPNFTVRDTIENLIVSLREIGIETVAGR